MWSTENWFWEVLMAVIQFPKNLMTLSCDSTLSAATKGESCL
jgi:hypothetical protein